MDLDPLTKDIKRKPDGEYTPVNARKRHDAVATHVGKIVDEHRRKEEEAKLPEAKGCNFCGKQKRSFRDITLKGVAYILCKDCEDAALVFGEPLGTPKFLDVKEAQAGYDDMPELGGEDGSGQE